MMTDHTPRWALAVLVVSLVWLAPIELGAAGDPPLVSAVKATDRDAVETLLGRGENVNGQAADGATALHWAVHRDDAALVEVYVNTFVSLAVALSVAARSGMSREDLHRQIDSMNRLVASWRR